MTTRRPWSDAETELLRERYPCEPTPALAARMGRTVSALRSRAKLLKLHKTTRRAWPARDVEELERRYPHEPTETLARSLGRSTLSVYGMAKSLGLKKTEAYLASPHAGRAQSGKGISAAGRWPKGHVPGNKGVQGWQAGGRSATTRFRKGHRPLNWVPVGTYRVNTDGYLDRKVSDTGSVRDWQGAHRLVWIEAHGPIPRGHIVIFRPGKRSTVLEEITPDALELVTRQELMRRNTIHNYPPELKETIRLVGRLKRTIEGKAS